MPIKILQEAEAIGVLENVIVLMYANYRILVLKFITLD